MWVFVLHLCTTFIIKSKHQDPSVHCTIESAAEPQDRQKRINDLQTSLKVIETGVIQKLGYGFLFAFYSNYGRICSYFGDIRLQRVCDLENRVRVRSRSLEMTPIDRPCTVSYSPSIVTMAVSAAILEIFSVKEWPDLEIWVWGPPRSLEMTRFDRPCMTFY